MLFLYNILVFGDCITALVLYFQISVIQLRNITMSESEWIPIIFTVLFGLFIVVNRKLHIGENISALGIFTIIAYLMFIFWAFLTAPKGPERIPLTGDPVNLIYVLIQSYSVCSLVVQNMLKNPNKGEYKKIIRYLFVTAGVVCTLILVFGGYGNIGLT